jgi:hypothetical protein
VSRGLAVFRIYSHTTSGREKYTSSGIPRAPSDTRIARLCALVIPAGSNTVAHAFDRDEGDTKTRVEDTSYLLRRLQVSVKVDIMFAKQQGSMPSVSTNTRHKELIDRAQSPWQRTNHDISAEISLGIQVAHGLHEFSTSWTDKEPIPQEQQARSIGAYMTQRPCHSSQLVQHYHKRLHSKGAHSKRSRRQSLLKPMQFTTLPTRILLINTLCSRPSCKDNHQLVPRNVCFWV